MDFILACLSIRQLRIFCYTKLSKAGTRFTLMNFVRMNKIVFLMVWWTVDDCSHLFTIYNHKRFRTKSSETLLLLEELGGSGRTWTSDLTLISVLIVHVNLIPIGFFTTSVHMSVHILVLFLKRSLNSSTSLMRSVSFLSIACSLTTE